MRKRSRFISESAGGPDIAASSSHFSGTYMNWYLRPTRKKRPIAPE